LYIEQFLIFSGACYRCGKEKEETKTKKEDEKRMRIEEVESSLKAVYC